VRWPQAVGIAGTRGGWGSGLGFLLLGIALLHRRAVQRAKETRGDGGLGSEGAEETGGG
jgi:hypothetical protein